MTDRRTLFESDLTRVARERDEARRALDDLRDRVEGFDVTRDELDAALDRAEKAEQERDDAREEAREWARQFNRRRAREALEGGDD